MNEGLLVNLYGGPNSGERRRLNHERVAFIRADGGHYARVSGGMKADFYWYECEPPWAVNVGGRLIPVEEYRWKP